MVSPEHVDVSLADPFVDAICGAEPHENESIAGDAKVVLGWKKYPRRGGGAFEHLPETPSRKTSKSEMSVYQVYESRDI